MWKIIDSKGILYSGTELDMRTIFRQIAEGKIQEQWNGNLYLIQVHDIQRKSNNKEL